MKISKSSEVPSKAKGKLRNFDLTVEEIRILKAIKDLTRALEDTQRKDTESVRLEYFRSEIRQLEDKLDEIRENTLIR